MRKLLLVPILTVTLVPRSHAAGESLSAGAAAAFHAAASLPPLNLLRTLAPAEFSALSGDPQDRLLELLDDANPVVRAEAAKALRHYAQTDYDVQRRLIAVASSRAEVEGVRREAVKSLAWAAQSGDAERTLLRLAEDSAELDGLRAIALKSLYVAAGRDHEARRTLLAALERGGKDLREAAAWSLAWATADWNAKRELVSVASSRSEPESLRIEAFKSLIHAMSDWEVQRLVRQTAEDKTAPVALRETAILELITINQDWQVKNFLEDTSRRGGDARLRTAAIKAMGGWTLELARFFHLSQFRGNFIDPLEDQ